MYMYVYDCICMHMYVYVWNMYVICISMYISAYVCSMYVIRISLYIYVYSWKLGGVYGGGLWISLDKLWISQWWLCSARNVWRGWCVVIYCKIERYQDLARVAWARLARNKQARTKMQLKSPGIDSLLANAWPMHSR